MKNAIYAAKLRLPRASTAAEGDEDIYRTLFPVEASQVGFLWRLCRRLRGNWADWVDEDPLELSAAAQPAAATAANLPAGPEVKPAGRKVKMAHILDQSDETEVLQAGRERVASWYQTWQLFAQGPPDEEEEPS
eukprot:9436394-Heterocapsa_arctica.AAC.1